jgi:hypothetical protein
VQVATFESVAPQGSVGVTTTTPGGRPVAIRRLSLHRRKRGVRVSFTLSAPATVRAVVERKTSGCRKQAHRCTRWVALGTIYNHSLPAGRTSFTIDEQHGSYRLLLRATDYTDHRSPVSTIGFRVR